MLCVMRANEIQRKRQTVLEWRANAVCCGRVTAACMALTGLTCVRSGIATFARKQTHCP